MSAERRAVGRFKPPHKGWNDHKQGFDKAMEDALKNAAREWPNGTYDARVTQRATVEVTNPAEIGEYRVIVDPD